MSAEHVVTIYGTAVLVCTPDGLPVDTEGATTDLIGEAISQRAGVVVVPVERLTDDFFDLGTGIAGEMAEKFSNYQTRLAVVGDISDRVAADPTLAAWLRRAGDDGPVWFLETFDELPARLDRRSAPRPDRPAS